LPGPAKAIEVVSVTDPEPEATDERRPPTPLWVKLFGVAVLVAASLVALILVAGGEHGPFRHFPASATPSVPTPSPGGQAPAGVGRPAAAGTATRSVTISALDSMSFEPSGVSVSAGETITFVVTNSGAAVHEFTLGDAAMQHEHAAQMEQMPGMAHDQPNSISLQPGETKQLTWQFSHATTIEYACHEPGHYEAGMRGNITLH
jgi:uncharacterized cupredoxin-like copper-binding protein